MMITGRQKEYRRVCGREKRSVVETEDGGEKPEVYGGGSKPF